MKLNVIQSLMAQQSYLINGLHISIQTCTAEARWMKERHEFDKASISWWYNEAEKDRKKLAKAVAIQMALKAELKAQKKPKVSKKHPKRSV